MMTSTQDNNPFIQPFDLPPFEKITPRHFLPAIEYAITQAKKEIEVIKNNTTSPTFENTIIAFEASGQLVSNISSIFFSLNSANTNKEMQDVARQLAPKTTEFSNEILLDKKLFEKVLAVKNQYTDTSSMQTLSKEDQTLLDKIYKNFVRHGALLNEKDQEKYRTYTINLTKLSLTFGENLLKENNDFELWIENEHDLEGIPPSNKAYYKHLATAKGKPDNWLITLDYPSYIPLITYSDNRSLRKKLYLAFASRCCKNNDNDNRSLIKDIVKSRLQLSQLLGYETYANFVLEERMAKNTDNVNQLIDQLYEKVLPLAKKEKDELVHFTQQFTSDALEAWDIAYYSEKLKMSKFGFNQEAMKPYFPLDQTLDGIFQIANRLYGISFKKQKNIKKYHDEVTTYEVYDKNNTLIAYFFTDFFPRPGKQQGAWMTAFQSYAQIPEPRKPQVAIVCNFSRPLLDEQKNKTPSLLTFMEVKTLFHEFGHALHGMMADNKYGSLAGTNVLWDFVELPSQIMENWCTQKECLDFFAKHYKTKASIPIEYIQQITASEKFNAGMGTLRQLLLAKLDISWHSMTDFDENIDVVEFEKKQIQPFLLFKTIEGNCTSTAFAHIFQGGYASGYYSYKWAEVLDADAFEYFEEEGIFNTTVAKKFHQLLSAGGAMHPAELYKDFRGREPEINALLRRIGV